MGDWERERGKPGICHNPWIFGKNGNLNKK
jgi:hypothetical protein